MLVLCPNHNTEMAFGVLHIDSTSLKIVHRNIANQYHKAPICLNENHHLSADFLEYHENEFCHE